MPVFPVDPDDPVVEPPFEVPDGVEPVGVLVPLEVPDGVEPVGVLVPLEVPDGVEPVGALKPEVPAGVKPVGVVMPLVGTELGAALFDPGLGEMGVPADGVPTGAPTELPEGPLLVACPRAPPLLPLA